jgi:ABC-type transport system substrate-binding protein
VTSSVSGKRLALGLELPEQPGHAPTLICVHRQCIDDVGPVVAGLVSVMEQRLRSHRGRLVVNQAKFFAHQNELGAEEPALSTDPGAYQIEFATCAKLLNYPDKPPPEGWQLQPEVAAAMPTLSGDGRTYTFRIRPGYRFSPPSNQPVTAETFRYSIERALSPRLAEGPVVSDPPGRHLIDDIEGEQAFLDGTASSISGLRAAGDTLSITLTRPSPDFLERLALPFFCPVPVGTHPWPAPRTSAWRPVMAPSCRRVLTTWRTPAAMGT